LAYKTAVGTPSVRKKEEDKRGWGVYRTPSHDLKGYATSDGESAIRKWSMLQGFLSEDPGKGKRSYEGAFSSLKVLGVTGGVEKSSIHK